MIKSMKLFVVFALALLSTFAAPAQTASSATASGDDGNVSYMVWKCCMVGNPFNPGWGFEWRSTILLVRTNSPATTGYLATVTVERSDGSTATLSAYKQRSALEPAQSTDIFFPISAGKITHVVIEEQTKSATHEFTPASN